MEGWLRAQAEWGGEVWGRMEGVCDTEARGEAVLEWEGAAVGLFVVVLLGVAALVEPIVLLLLPLALGVPELVRFGVEVGEEVVVDVGLTGGARLAVWDEVTVAVDVEV